MITTLVPAFKPEFFPSLLHSLDAQSIKPRRVIVSDDTEASSFSAVAFQDNNVRTALKRLNGTIIRGPRKGYHRNIRHLLSEYQKESTDFFHILLDDDEVAPSFYEDHLQAHKSFSTICCVSRRLILREREKEPRILSIPSDLDEIFPGQRRVPLEKLVKSLVIDGEWNWLGELSCMTLRREFLDLEPGFNSFGGIELEGLNDIATLIKSASYTDVLFLTEPKGFFRVSKNSISSKRGFFFSLSILGIILLAISLVEKGKISRVDVAIIVRRALREWRAVYGDGTVMSILDWLCDLSQSDYDVFKLKALTFWSNYRALTEKHKNLSTRDELIRALESQGEFSVFLQNLTDD